MSKCVDVSLACIFASKFSHKIGRLVVWGASLYTFGETLSMADVEWNGDFMNLLMNGHVLREPKFGRQIYTGNSLLILKA